MLEPTTNLELHLMIDHRFYMVRNVRINRPITFTAREFINLFDPAPSFTHVLTCDMLVIFFFIYMHVC